MNYKRIAVLRGGPSQEYDVSMKTGRAVIDALKALGYPLKDITITRKGEWLENGMVRRPEQALEAVDTVFIALHGEYGEDGGIQRVLQRLNLPFTGSNALSSAIAYNKDLTKQHLVNSGVKLPKHKIITKADLPRLDSLVEELNTALGQELFLKPASGGSSIGATHAPTPEVVKASIKAMLDAYDSVMVEEFIRGKEATVAVLEDFRNTPLYALPAIEIVPPNGEPMFSYDDKYNGITDEICPGRFSYHEKSQLEEAARIVHKHLNCSHYSRSDFIVRNGEVYFLEINTLPGLTNESLVPKAAQAVGLTFNELIDHLIRTARP